MDVGSSATCFEPMIGLRKRSTLRSSNSSVDLGASARLLQHNNVPLLGYIVDNATVHDTLLSNCPPPCEFSDHPATSLFPRLVLRDKSPDFRQYSPLDNLFVQPKLVQPEADPSNDGRPGSYSSHISPQMSPSAGPIKVGTNSNIPKTYQGDASADGKFNDNKLLDSKGSDNGLNNLGWKSAHPFDSVDNIGPTNSEQFINPTEQQPKFAERKPWLPEFINFSHSAEIQSDEGIEKAQEQGINKKIREEAVKEIEKGIEQKTVYQDVVDDTNKRGNIEDQAEKDPSLYKWKGLLDQPHIDVLQLHIPQETITTIQDRAVNNINITPEQRDVIFRHMPPGVRVKSLQRNRPVEPPVTNEQAQYWGFVPAVKDAVQNAAAVAARKVVHDVVPPPNAQHKDASSIYRKLVADSLTEAARTADEYLRRSPAFNDQFSRAPARAGLHETTQAGSVHEQARRNPTPHKLTNASQPLQTSENIVVPPRGSSSPKSIKQSVQGTLAAGLYSPSQYSGMGNSAASVIDLKSPPRATTQGSTSYEQPMDVEKQFRKNANKHAAQNRSTRDQPGVWNSFGTVRHKSGYVPIPETETAPEVSRKTSLDQIINKASQKLRSVSSMASLRSGSGIQALRKSPHVPSSDRKELSTMRMVREVQQDKFDKRRTVHWLRGVLVDDGPYAARYTALPQHNQLDTSTKAKLTKSQTASPPVARLLLDLPTKPDIAKGKRNDRNSSGARISETFTRTIDDLENLMNEALHIARIAATKENSEHIPALLEDAATLLHQGRIEPVDSLNTYKDNKSFKRMGNNASFDSIHESARSDLSGSLDSLSYTASEDGQSDVEHGGDENFETQIVGSPEPWIAAGGSQSRTLISPPKTTILLHPMQTAGIIVDVSDNLDVPDQEVLPLEIEHYNANTAFLSSSPPVELGAREVPLNTDEMPPDAALPQNGKNSRDLIGASRPGNLPNKKEVNDFIRAFNQPPIAPRGSSLTSSSLVRRRTNTGGLQDQKIPGIQFSSLVVEGDRFTIRTLSSFQSDGPVQSDASEMIHFGTPNGLQQNTAGTKSGSGGKYELTETVAKKGLHLTNSRPKHLVATKGHHRLLDLRGKSHISLEGNHHHGFSMSRTHKRQPIARDWSTGRKRFVASVSCISTAMIGIVAGIYAGEVPSIQYYIADLNHYAILGNVVFFIALSLPVFLLWPLPLLHGRKPYVMGSLTIAMPLLFPQAVVTGVQRSPDEAIWRAGLLVPRAAMGLALGLAQMNFMNTLLDLFGASLQSANPHQEVVDEFDVRRHGGGMGVWLGLWTWCYCASIGIGFHIGAWIIDTLSPDWGFYVGIVIIAVVLLLNVVTPEVRRSAYRKSVAEIRTATEITRRLAKGEVKMHRVQSGPAWFGEEVYHGILLSLEMLRQPGFLIMVLYVSWIYAQIVLVVVLLGSLTSKVYSLKSPVVGATTSSIPLGAMMAIPFQKAGLFSRDRRHNVETDMQTFQKQVHWSSHLVRRTIFTILLPFAGLAYTLSSGGPPIPVAVPVGFACMIGFLSNLAIAECNGIIMETFDTSDLQPGMTGRPRGASGNRTKHKRTNYSSFPRIASAFSLVQGFGFLIASAATGVGGVAQRNLGQQASTSVMGGILLILTILLLLALTRFQEIQIIPDSQAAEMEQWERERRQSIKKLEEKKKSNSWNSQRGISNVGQGDNQSEEEEPWRPIIIGNPMGKTRRMSLLEMGGLTRWSEIRRRNKLIDEGGLEAYHPNRAALHLAKQEIKRHGSGSLRRMRRHARRGGELARNDSGRSFMSDESGNGDIGERSRLK